MLVQRFMETTSFVLGAAAIALILAPELVLARLAIEPTPAVLPLVQLYGAALFGLAMTAWMARTMLLGGIYGRAIVTGGFAHAFTGAFVLVHAIRATPANAFLWGACALYALLALAFGALMFGRGPAAPSAETLY
ncbi:MAG: hypothetical protein JJD97_02995 [Gemmatimonadaceae bacterium]|nr:hypothetical protein [Gemmatimonadaceae bacterium]